MRDTGTFIQSELASSILGRPTEPILTREELMVSVDWSDTTTRLLGYARRKISWYGGPSAAFGQQASDLVQESIVAFLEGRRVFEMGTTTELFRYLCGTIDSFLSHGREKKARRGPELSISSEGTDYATGEVCEDRIPATGNFEREILFHDQLDQFVQFLDCVDHALAAYARYLAAVPDSSAEERAADRLVSVATIRNLDRRLHRWGRQWLHQITQ